MKLATLAAPIQAAYRDGRIDTATAEAFACVPDERQMVVWEELRGDPQHAQHVRNVIANGWIDASRAIFDVSTLKDSVVSRDLFSERVLVEREAFMDAQSAALTVEKTVLEEEGWAEAVLGKRQEVQDRLYAMDTPSQEFDGATQRKLQKIATRREKLQAVADKIDENDERRFDRIQAKFEALEDEERATVKAAPVQFSEATKAIGTAFLMLDPDGRVCREFRVPRRRGSTSTSGNGDGVPDSQEAKPRTSEDLSDGQRSATFTHHVLAIREGFWTTPRPANASWR